MKNVREKIKQIKESKKNMAIVIIAAAFLVIAAVSGIYFMQKGKNHQAMVFEKRSMGDKPVDVNTPSSIWKFVASDYDIFNLKKQSGEAPEEGASEPKKQDKNGVVKLVIDNQEIESLMKRHPPTETFGFKIILVEKTQGVLDGKNFEIKYPSGGGVLDLGSYVSDAVKGTFYLKVIWNEEELPSKITKIYFLSRSKEREVVEINSMRESKKIKLGMGCEHSYDLTNYWQKSMKFEGLMLNTTSDRHISLLSGIYYFNVFKDGKIFNANLEILDSRHRDLLCVH